jgi:hypothetical protein
MSIAYAAVSVGVAALERARYSFKIAAFWILTPKVFGR